MSKLTSCNLLVAGLASMLSACTTLYLPKPGEATTLVNLRETGNVQICLNGQKFAVGAGLNEEYARFPANVPFTIQVTKVVGGTSTGTYSVTYSCSPALGVSRVDVDRKYFLNFEISKDSCRLELYEETTQSPIGLLPTQRAPAQRCK